MKKIIFIIVIIFIIAAIITAGKSGLSFKQPKALIQSQTFNLLFTKTEKERQVGLSGRNSIPKDTGMLFKFEKADYYSFWMKNMKFPIDIIFIKDQKIVTIYSKVQPASEDKLLATYQPQEPADTVLEINAGLSEKYGFSKNTTIKYENLGN